MGRRFGLRVCNEHIRLSSGESIGLGIFESEYPGMKLVHAIDLVHALLRTSEELHCTYTIKVIRHFTISLASASHLLLETRLPLHPMLLTPRLKIP